MTISEQQEIETGTPPRSPSISPGKNPDYMSYSRMNSILTCGEQFRLERVLKMPSREHWASIGGNAFHSSVERILKDSFSSEVAI